MSKNVVSPDMTVLDFEVLLDLSTAIPSVKVTNKSTVSNAAGLVWAFALTSPYGGPIHVGEITSPDVTGLFTTFDIPGVIPQPFGQVEFNMANGYVVLVTVKDSQGNIFSLSKSGAVCKPNGNTGKNNFGAAEVSIEAKCNQSQLYVTDKTNVLYKSLTGTRVSSTTKVTYPTDNFGNTPTPITSQTMPSLFPLKVSGDGHNIYVAYVYEYDLGDGFKVRIRYSFKETFAVWCNVDLCPLFCEVEKLTDLVSKDCSNGAEKRVNTSKLQLINAKLLKAVAGILQPLCGWDVPKIIEEIKEIGGFTCDCCRPQGIHSGSLLVADANFTVNKVCGDMLLSWQTDVNGNIQLNYQDKSYAFIMDADPKNTDAITLTTTETNCVKTTKLFVDKALLAEEILVEIQNNPTLLNILNGLITNQQLACPGLTGLSILGIGNCDYTITIATGIVNVSILSILIAGVTYNAPGGLLATQATAVASWLNGLNKGSFTAVYSSVNNNLVITSNGNPNQVTSIGLSSNIVNGNLYSQNFNNNCGLICNIIQAIINFLAALKMVQVKVGGTIKVCFLQKGTIVEQTFGPNDDSFALAQALSASVCSLANNLLTGKISEEVLKNSFSEYTNGMADGADFVLMSYNGTLTKFPLKNLAMSVFQLLGTDVDVKAVYCSNGKCTSVGDCNSVTGLTVSPGDTTAAASWNAVVGAIGYKYSTNGSTWISVLSTAANVTGLTASTAYTFRVYPVYNSGDGVACQINLGFNTTGVGAGCAAPGSFVVDQIGTNAARLTWNAVANVSGYRYQLNGGSWVNVGNVLTTNLSGLDAAETYNVSIQAIIGGTPCSMSSSASFDTLEEGIFLIDNNSTGAASITAVEGPGSSVLWYNLTSGTLPVAAGAEASGNVSNFAGVIKVVLAGASATLSLYKNGGLVENISGSIGANDFESIAFSNTDNIAIVAGDPA